MQLVTREDFLGEMIGSCFVFASVFPATRPKSVHCGEAFQWFWLNDDRFGIVEMGWLPKDDHDIQQVA